MSRACLCADTKSMLHAMVVPPKSALDRVTVVETGSLAGSYCVFGVVCCRSRRLKRKWK
jgi:hypothetical protein